MESLSFQYIWEETHNKFIQIFYDSYFSATTLYTHENKLHLSALSNEKLIEPLVDHFINLDYTYIIHLFNHCYNSQLEE